MKVHPYFYALVIDAEGMKKVLKNHSNIFFTRQKIKHNFDKKFVQYVIDYFGGYNDAKKCHHNVFINSVISLYYLYCGYTITKAARAQKINHATLLTRLNNLYARKSSLEGKKQDFFRLHPELLIQLNIYINRKMRPIRSKSIKDIVAKLDKDRDAVVELCNKKGNAITVNDYFYDKDQHRWFFIDLEGKNYRADMLFLPE